jgi:hypothetical protein
MAAAAWLSFACNTAGIRNEGGETCPKTSTGEGTSGVPDNNTRLMIHGSSTLNDRDRDEIISRGFAARCSARAHGSLLAISMGGEANDGSDGSMTGL